MAATTRVLIGILTDTASMRLANSMRVEVANNLEHDTVFESRSIASSATSTEALLTGANYFLAQEASAVEVRNVRSLPAIQKMESHGLPLATLFGWHTLAEYHTAETEPMSVSYAKAILNRGDGSISAQSNAEVVAEGVSMMERMSKAGDEIDKALDLAIVGGIQLHSSSAPVFIPSKARKMLGQMMPAIMLDRPEFFEDVAFGKDLLSEDPTRTNDTDLIQAKVKKESESSYLQEVLVSYRSFRHHLVRERRRHRQPKPLARENPEAYQRWRREESARALSYWNNTEISEDAVPRAQDLLKSSIALHSQLENFLSMLDEEPVLDLSKQATTTGRRAKLWRHVRDYFKRTYLNTVNLFKQSWKTFRSRLRKQEDKCISDERQAEGIIASKAGHKPAPELLNSQDEISDADMSKELNSLDPVFEMYGKQEVSDQELAEDVRTLKKDGKQFTESARSGDVDQAALQKTSAGAALVVDKICKDVHAQQAKKLKTTMQKFRNMSLAALQIATPGYGIRGMSAAVSFAMGGLEEVIDFRNREIGYFRFGSFLVGPSALNVQAGGYVGIAWKGYKENWTLQDAYQTAIWMSGPGVSIPVPFPMGIGTSFCTDADNSGPVWIMELNGVNGFTIGPAVSYGLFSAIPGLSGVHSFLGLTWAPNIPVFYDFGISKYWMLTSECFDTFGSFVRGIWRIDCKTCDSAGERFGIGLMRTISHLVSFPIVTETLHTLLAWSYEKLRPKNYAFPCSDASTRNRNNPKHLVATLTRNLAQSVLLIQKVKMKIDEFDSEVTELVASQHNKSLITQRNWIDIHRIPDLCMKQPYAPPKLAHYEDDVEELGNDPDVVKQVLWRRSKDELVQLCIRVQYSRIRCHKYMGHWGKRRLAEIIADRIAGVSNEENPFGRCRKSTDCPLEGTTCQNVDGVKSCACDKSRCLGLEADGRHICVEFKQGIYAAKQVIDSMNTWIMVRQIEVGTYLKELEILIDPNFEDDEGDGPHDELTEEEVQKINERYNLTQFAPDHEHEDEND